MSKRIAVSTGGGDCPGLNAVIRAVVKAGIRRGWEVYGIEDGFEGFLHHDRTGIRRMDDDTVSGILPRGGTILGTTNRGNPFQYRVVENGDVRQIDRSNEVVEGMRELGFEALVAIGGDGTLRIAHDLARKGVPVVGVPKTIDNDLSATEVTFGFDTALMTAMEALDKLHTTAESHDRVMVLEVMGRDAGWIALHAGMSGGGDIILIPEIPFSVDQVIRDLEARSARGRSFSLVVVAEGARPAEGGPFYVSGTGRDPAAPARLGGIGNWLASQLEGRVNHEVRATVLGHVQRGGSPTARDRMLGTRFGVRAVELVEAGQLDHMVALRNDEIVAVPLGDAVAQIKHVPPDGELVRAARSVGITFGDGR